MMNEKRVGDCLEYALVDEFFQEMYEDVYIKAVIMYLVLYGYIDRLVQKEISILLLIKEGKKVKRDKIFDKIVKLLMKELKKKYKGCDFEQIIICLNVFVIPEWIFQNAAALEDIDGKEILINDMLYYIEDDPFPMLRVVNSCCFSDRKIFSREIADNHDTCCGNYTISHMFSWIFGYDEQEKALYLQLKYDKNYFAKYFVNTGQTALVRGEGMGSVEDRPVIKKGRRIYIVLKGGEWKELKKEVAEEEYTICSDGILISPSVHNPSFFIPYLLNARGEKKEIDYTQKWIFAMQRIANEVYPVRCQFEIHCPLNSANELTYEKLCITYLKEYMKYCKSHEGWDPNEKYARLIAFMELFFSGIEDLLDIILVLEEVSANMRQTSEYVAINEKLLDIMEEWYRNGESIDFEASALRDRLYSQVGHSSSENKKFHSMQNWDDDDYNLRGYVGAFYFDGDNILHAKPRQRRTAKNVCGYCMGTNPEEYPGMVVFDRTQGLFKIQYDRMLTVNEINQVVDDFGLLGYEYDIYIVE